MENENIVSFKLADTKDSKLISELIGKSFKNQVDILGIRKEEYPNYVAFETAEGVKERIYKGDVIIIAYLKDEPIGTVSFNIDSNQVYKGYIKRLAVIPEFRGYGYGNMLMDDTEMKLKERGVTLVELSLVAQFEKLQRFYERLGYTAKEKKFVSSLPFEILFMEKVIGISKKD
jgi:ribosomal protein S18 acetylase RimI-like enzyme